MEKAGEQGYGFGHRPEIFDLLGSGRMSEEEAREFAQRLVRRARDEGGEREPEATAPPPEEVRRRREARRGRHA